jgi:hypothetical protein
MDDLQMKTEETPDLISKDQIEKNGTGGDGSETSDEFVKVDQDDELAAEESAGITELEPAAPEEQLMEPLVPAPAVEEVQEEPEPVVEASPETEVIAAKVEEPEPTVVENEVMDLLYWKDIKKSAIVFSLLLLTLTSLNYYSSILVCAYISMSMIAITMTCRVYSFAVQTINGTQLQNPFLSQLNEDVTISEAQAMDYVKYLLPKVNCVLSQAQDVIFVNKFVNTLKFGVLAWILSYIGEWFNGLSLIIVGVIAAFTAPPLYKKYNVEINQHVGCAMKKLNQIISQVKSKIPGQKPKVQ